MINEYDIMQAIITLYEGCNLSDAMDANEVLDTFCAENPLHPIADLIDRFIEAANKDDFRTFRRIAEYAYDYVLENP